MGDRSQTVTSAQHRATPKLTLIQMATTRTPLGKIFLNKESRSARRKTDTPSSLQSKLDAVSSTYSDAISEVESMLTCLDNSFTCKERAEQKEKENLLLEIAALKAQLVDKDDALKLTSQVNDDLEDRLIVLMTPQPKRPPQVESSPQVEEVLTLLPSPVKVEAPMETEAAEEASGECTIEPVEVAAIEWEAGQEFEAVMHETHLPDTCTKIRVGRVAGAGIVALNLTEMESGGVTFAMHQSDKFVFGLRKVSHTLPRHKLAAGRKPSRRSFTHTLFCGPTVLSFKVSGGKHSSSMKITQQMAESKAVVGTVQVQGEHWESLITLVEAMTTLVGGELSN